VQIEGDGFLEGCNPLKRRCEARKGFVRKRKNGKEKGNFFLIFEEEKSSEKRSLGALKAEIGFQGQRS